MRIGILAGGDGWHVRDLQRAGISLNHDVVPIDFRRISAGVAATWNSIDDCESVLVRTMPPGSLEQVIFRMDLLQRLQANGVVVLNPPRAVEICVDKYLTSACLQAAGMLVPETIVCQHADAALEAFEALGGDVIVKPLFGSEGRGMIRVQDQETAWRAFRTLERLQAVLYLQKYIAHPGWDLRAFVIGGEVVAAMKRRANGCWRTNVAQGGKAEAVRLTAAQQELALRAAAAVQAPVAGVDLLPGPGGELYVLEVNAVPGWRALAPASGVDVAQLILRFLCAQVRGR
ncbi:MAG TPA: RimK family alpha-L-glutamate ligase [Gemmataceae bacterium]|nr:RimK family alpha-L-glutamate ligase [Gemmataceae bacterium]